MIGEFLYQLTPRDQQVTGLELHIEKKTFSNAAFTVGVQYQVPLGRVLLLNHLRIAAIANPAATLQYLFAYILSPFDSNPMELFNVTGQTNRIDTYGAIISAAYGGDRRLDLAIPEGYVVGAQGTWDNAANPNRCEMTIGGIEIPRGTIAI